MDKTSYKYKIFIDGSEGTTGLSIYQRLASRDDLQLLTLPDQLRKDSSARREMLNHCDVAFLCLPDDAARESVTLADNDALCIIDASTAHRTAPGWTYGFPELSPARSEQLQSAKRIAIPGCHASGFISLIAPLVDSGLLPVDADLTCFSVTGYTGGGKKMIAQYEISERSCLLDSPRQYGLTQTHKHLPEMQAICGLTKSPLFCPVVADFPRGMCVTVPLFISQLAQGATMDCVKQIYRELYTGPIVTYYEEIDEDGFIAANSLANRDSMQITVSGNAERLLLVSRFDNLGKGASGAAVECMNIVLGCDPTYSLSL